MAFLTWVKLWLLLYTLSGIRRLRAFYVGGGWSEVGAGVKGKVGFSWRTQADPLSEELGNLSGEYLSTSAPEACCV